MSDDVAELKAKVARLELLVEALIDAPAADCSVVRNAVADVGRPR